MYSEMGMSKEFSKEDYKKIWGQFYEDFSFNPSIDPKSWPGIDEPDPSITISLTESRGGKWPEEKEVMAFFRIAFNQLPQKDRIRYILDWCHVTMPQECSLIFSGCILI